MVEEDAVTREEIVRLTVIDGQPVCIELRRCIWAARPEWCRLSLRDLRNFAVHFGAARLIEASRDLRLAKCLEDPNRPEGGDVAGVFRDVKAHAHVALRGQMIDLVRLDPVQKLDKVRRIRYVA